MIEPVYTLWIPGRLPGLNEVIEENRRNRYKGAALKKNATMLVKLTAREGFKALMDGPYEWRFTWYEADRRRNPDNIASAVKFIFDGLQHQGVIRNDGWGQVGGIHHAFEIGTPGVRVEAWEVRSDAHACALATEPVLKRDWEE